MSADFTPEKEDYKILTPFKMQVQTNFPYIEADFDALTNYGLLCKVVEYLNNVIANENEVTEQVTSLYNAYVALQNYVNTYFDNLDLTGEVSAKLDEMAEDGTLTNLIKDYVDPLYETFEEDVNQRLYDQTQAINYQDTVIQNFKTQVNEEITTIDNKVNNAVSGSPKGVYATVSDLETDNPDHDYIYVVTADGKWYYYDTTLTAWTAGGTYQSTEISESDPVISSLRNDIDSIAEVTYSQNLYDPSTDSVGIVTNDGTFDSSVTTWKTTDYIYVGNGNKVTMKGATSYLGTNGFTYLAYYTAEKEFLTRDIVWNNDGVSTRTMVGTQAYIRIMGAVDMTPCMVNLGETLLPYTPYNTKTVEFTDEAVNDILEIVKTDNLKTVTLTVDVNGSGDYTSLRDAVDYIDSSSYEASIIYIKPGTYDIANYYSSAEMTTPGFVGLKMPINCQLIGTGDRDDTIITLTLATRNQNISTLNIQSNFTMKNVTVYGEKTRYTIHDDFGYSFTNDKRLIENCKISGTDLYYANAYGSGNTRNGAEWIFKDCIFSADATPFSNHNGTGTVTKNNTISFINCRFINTSSIDNQGYALMFRSLSNAMGVHWTLVNLYGCEGNGKIVIGEENAQTYGSGLRFRVTGYADSFGEVVLSHSDVHDYSDIVDII